MGRIKDLPNQARSVAADDFEDLDGVTNGSRKILSIEKHLAFAGSRAIADSLYFDGATSAGRVLWTMPAAGLTGALTNTFLFTFKVPTTAALPTATLFRAGSAPLGGTGNAMYFLLSGNDRLRFTLANGPDYREEYVPNFTATYGGRWVKVAVCKDVSTSTLTIYINGIAQSTTTVSGGTPPPWSAAFEDDFWWQGAAGIEVWIGSVVPVVPILGALTAAEVLAWTQTGRLPTWCEVGTGSAVAAYTSDFSAGADSWSADSPTTVTGNADGVNGSNDWLKTERLTSNGPLYIRSAPGNNYAEAKFGQVRYYSARVYIPAGSSITHIAFWTNNGQTYTTGVAVSPDTEYVITATLPTSTSLMSGIRATDSSGSSATTQVVGTHFYVKDFVARVCGPIFKPVVQPGVPVLTDSGENRIPGLLTSGVTAIGDRRPTIEIPIPAMSADGFIHADQIIVPAGYELFSAVIERTVGASTGTVTIRETSSGGTTVATGTLGAAPVSLTLSNVFSAANKKLHLANSSWSSSTLKGHLLFRRYQ
jgi:hypothetical protein